MESVCILGSTGLLGQALVNECKRRKIGFVGVARKEADFQLDITNDVSLKNFIVTNDFDVVINTVALVNHCECDSNPAKAYLVNARPSSLLSSLSNECGFKYVFVSTDGYFYGDGNKKHDENSKISILNEYARTKYLGENLSALANNYLVIRTNIVGFKNSTIPTFFEWALDTVSSGAKITLFNDYYTSSISVSQFSRILFDLIDLNITGYFNLASSEVSSKKCFIEAMAKVFNLELKNFSVGSVAELPSKRADSLGLDVSKVENILGYRMPNLYAVLEQLKREYDELQK